MDTAAVLAQLKELGVGVEVGGGDIYMEPFSVVPAPLLAQVREHKQEIIGVLIGPCGCCKGTNYWWRPDGTGPVCSVCHPDPRLLRAEWEAQRAMTEQGTRR